MELNEEEAKALALKIAKLAELYYFKYPKISPQEALIMAVEEIVPEIRGGKNKEIK